MSSPDDASPVAAPVEEDEAPDMVRMGILSAILVLLVGYFVYARFINPPPKKYYTQMEGFESVMAAMTPQQRDEVLKQANAMQCDCGYPNCSYNVAECRHMDPGCDVSAKHAAEIIGAVTGKVPPLPANLEPGAQNHMPGQPTAGAPPGSAVSPAAKSSATTPTAPAAK